MFRLEVTSGTCDVGEYIIATAPDIWAGVSVQFIRSGEVLMFVAAVRRNPQ
ncbi:hypothetical protein [Enterococcus faecium]|uniref:hypothetical protein n=1 Tax=Enterococcus faecium TaxID=1352 RepID=UPI0025AEE78A|nr:hypothetical protein [Enterococcus faecium]MDN3040644.1 hypothetical protein [Enterococcus faecium]